MSEQRPYDEDQLQRLTDHMLDTDTRTVHHPVPETREPDPATSADIEPYPGTFREAGTALSGLRRALTPRGRAHRARQRARQSAHRQAVVSHVADRITNPRQTDDPNEKTAWVGTHKPEDESGQPNILRPATRSEIAADRRIERKILKERRARNKSQWLESSYGSQLDARSGHRFSRPERKHMRYTAKQIKKLDRKAEVSSTKRDLITKTGNTPRYYLEAKKYDVVRTADRLKVPQAYESVVDSAYALGDEILDRHYEALDLTKEQMERLRNTTAFRCGHLAVKGTVALTKFYKEAGQNAGKLYLRGGKHVAKKTAKHASQTTAKVKSRVRSKKSEHSDQ